MNTKHISNEVDKYYKGILKSIQSSLHSQVIPTPTYEQCIIHASEIGYLCNHIKTILKACDKLTTKIEDHVPIPWRPLEPLQ